VTNKTPKRQYRIRNWRHYNKALVQRGSLTLWLDSHAIETWLNTDQPTHRGRARFYADVAIRCSLMLREVYHLPLRATEGLVCSLLSLLAVDLPVPHYSTLSRRARSLAVQLSVGGSKGPLHLVIDSTGLKLYGEGEWRVRGKGWTKRRTWRKLHLAMDGETQQFTSVLITNKDVVDPRVLPRLLKEVVGSVECVTADGAYDSRECYKAIDKLGARAVIPPRKGSTLWADEYLQGRNSNLRGIRKFGLKRWKKRAGYHRRSLIETAMFRLKTIFTDKLRSREVERQRTEAKIRCLALNRMTQLGMPESYPI
jgi:Transposase DDE domain